MRIKTSYIIITWNGKSLLQNLFQSMTSQLKRDDIEVIVTDNGSTDGTVQWIQQEYPDVRLILLPQNKGVAYARNKALAAAKGKYLLILDNDICITDQAIFRLEEYMDLHPEVGMVGCKLLYPTGELQESCKPYPGIWQKIKHVLFPSVSTMAYAKQIEEGKPFEPDYLIGACQMVRADVYHKIGPLDEHIFYGPEDCDYCIRVRCEGLKVVYIPYVSMVHHCQRKTTTRPFSKLGREHIKALFYFYWKHKRL